MESTVQKKKEKKLSAEIAKVVSLVLVIILISMNAISIILSERALTSAIDGEFLENTSSAEAQVENILISARSAAVNINAYLEKAYKLSKEGYRNMAGTDTGRASAVNISSVYGVEITEMSADVEKYITELVRQTAKENQDIVGMGVLFEPYAFDENIKDYAFYVLGEESEKEIEPFSKYEDYSAEQYYSKAAKSKSPEFTDPYEDNGAMLVTYSKPILYNGELKGVIIADINVTNFAKVFRKNSNYPSKYITILNDNETVVYDSDDVANVGARLDEFVSEKYYSRIKELMGKQESFSIDIRRSDNTAETCYYTPIVLDDITWWALTALETKDKNETIIQTLVIMILLTIISLAAVTGIVVYCLRKMLRPIDAIVIAAESIAEGNLGIEIKAETNDEIGKLAEAFQRTAVCLKNIIEDETYLLENMAKGNFNVSSKAKDQYKGDFEPVLTSLDAINSRLSEALEEINESSVQVSSASEQMANASQTLAEGSSEQAGAVEELLATVQAVSEQVEKNARDASGASDKANLVGGYVQESNSQMEQMTGAMNKISDTSKQIVAIIGAIEDIASQTNLLSLNASIEAARAGEVGKGFAVVADEIGKLASESQKAANNTRELIQTAISEVETGNQIADETARSLEQVTEGIMEITGIAEAVKESSEQQAIAIEQVTEGIEQISEVVQSNSATAEESSATSEELSAQAIGLSTLVGRFELKK